MTPKNTSRSVRELARQAIDSVFIEDGDPAPTKELERLNPEDRGLYQELTHGVLREWGFLVAVIGELAKRTPKGRLQTLIALGGYQLLFLDRVPAYAIFSETKKLCEAIGSAEAETKFVHGVLKAIERDKAKWLERRGEALEKLTAGKGPDNDLEWGVLNAPKNLVDAFTINDAAVSKKEARPRAVRALAAMRLPSELVGYALPGRTPNAGARSYESTVAPEALTFDSGPELSADLESGIVRIQGEASQWVCAVAAREMLNAARASGGKLRVLEMAAGKGGKLLGTLTHLTRLVGGNPKDVPEMTWLAADASGTQLEIFETDAQRLAAELWPQVETEAVQTNFQGATLERESFDFIWLDAPCTGFGTLGKLPQIGLTRGENAYEEAKRMALLQQNLCSEGLRLRSNGRAAFLYSVCTLTRPETLDLADYCVKQEGVKIERAEALWPGHAPAPRAEGFYFALFR